MIDIHLEIIVITMLVAFTLQYIYNRFTKRNQKKDIDMSHHLQPVFEGHGFVPRKGDNHIMIKDNTFVVDVYDFPTVLVTASMDGEELVTQELVIPVDGMSITEQVATFNDFLEGLVAIPQDNQ